MNLHPFLRVASFVLVVIVVDWALDAIGSAYSFTGAGTPESMFQLIRSVG